MFNITKKQTMWGGRPLILETGKVARQADGTVIATYGDTIVMAAVVAAKAAKPDQDFFPLTVHYIEKFYAAGKIPGGYFRREAKPTERETLIARLIDRPIRPLFADEFKNETQVVCTVLQHDGVNDPDVVALIAASAALTISGIPFLGPIGAAKVGYINGEYVLNPSIMEMPESKLDLVVAGTEESVLMVESEAQELSEEVMLGAVNFGLKNSKTAIDLIIALADEAAKEPWALPEIDNSELYKAVKKIAEKPIREAYGIVNKQERVAALSAAKKEVLEKLVNETTSAVLVGGLLKKLEMDVVRGGLIETGKRIDGRDVKKVRPIEAEVDILPRTHGSALFTRGETQALVVATLGTSQDEQMLDELDGDKRDRFMLHYNFPPYSVGEATPLRPPGRREIGHGRLAKRAILPLLPSKEEFPYAIRLVSEITESNGSSSMASVCGGSMALMAAGVPLARPVAGIAMGLILEGKKYVVLSDIMGDEDHLGDMDFKVAGTDEGITALQMDIKVRGITEEIMKVALEQAHEGRKHILGEMSKAITGARGGVSQHAPKVTTIQIPKDKIREVIGTGGKVIRELCEETGTKIDIEQDGTVRIASTDAEKAQIAVDRIMGIVAEPEMGMIYDGKVVDIVDFGAFVQFLGARQGLVHISELAFSRVEKVGDVLKVGDEVKVKCIGMDRGKVRLSYRMVNQETGEDAELPEGFEVRAPRSDNDRGERRGGRDRGDRGDRGGDRGERRERSNDDGEDRGEDRPRRRRPF